MIKTLALVAIGAFAALPVLPQAALAAAPTPGNEIEWCYLDGGEIIEQPAGSSIAACCTADGCIICDADWSDCSFEPAARRATDAALEPFSSPGQLAPEGNNQSTAGQLTAPMVGPVMRAQ